MNKYRDFCRRDRNPNPASTARQTQRIDKNSSRTAGRHKYSNKSRLCVVGLPSEHFVSRMHTVVAYTCICACPCEIEKEADPLSLMRLPPILILFLAISFLSSSAVIMFRGMLRVRYMYTTRLRQDQIDFELFCMYIKRIEASAMSF